ncbi:hypothetical protein [Thermincola potens]|uniref:Uncharacterized protein n=1 Tax=Thermincola potens (strain JR) TaxID=635013 RepID=D5X8C3_THEPJ|nr:hypothetical protein [Thermincola potens]ADG80902.1 hypothetical protein TherJR_0006 [Thermincola potens JR]
MNNLKAWFPDINQSIYQLEKIELIAMFKKLRETRDEKDIKINFTPKNKPGEVLFSQI